MLFAILMPILTDILYYWSLLCGVFFAKLALSLMFCSVIGLDTWYSCHMSPITSLRVVWLCCFFFLPS